MSYSDRDDRQASLWPAAPVAEEDVEHDGYLAIGVWPMDCLNDGAARDDDGVLIAAGVRPCPFAVRCRHHLLFNEIHSVDGPAKLVINQARDPRLTQIRRRGRQEEIARDATDYAKIEGFAIAALERLWELPDTCSREVANRAYDDEAAEAERLDRPTRFEVMTWGELAPMLGVNDEDQLMEEGAFTAEGLRGEVIAAGADPKVEHEAIAVLAGDAEREPVESALARLRLALYFGCEPREVDERIDRVMLLPSRRR